jgi:hypothetical protein
MTMERERTPSWWDWLAFCAVFPLHIGFPLVNWLLGYRPRWVPADMGDKTGQVRLILRFPNPRLCS